MCSFFMAQCFSLLHKCFHATMDEETHRLIIGVFRPKMMLDTNITFRICSLKLNVLFDADNLAIDKLDIPKRF